MSWLGLGLGFGIEIRVWHELGMLDFDLVQAKIISFLCASYQLELSTASTAELQNMILSPRTKSSRLVIIPSVFWC